MGTRTQIVSGIATVYIQAQSSTSPVSSNTATWTNWTELGFKTQDGVQTEYTPEFLDIRVEEHNALVRKDLIGEELTITLTLQESDLAQMQYAIAGATYAAASAAGSDSNDLTLGDGTVSEYSLGISAISAENNSNVVVLWFPRVVATGAVGTPYQKGAVRVVPITFTALADPTLSDGATLATYYEITSA